MAQFGEAIAKQIMGQCYTDLELREKLKAARINVARCKEPPRFAPLIIAGRDYWPKDLVDAWITKQTKAPLKQN